MNEWIIIESNKSSFEVTCSTLLVESCRIDRPFEFIKIEVEVEFKFANTPKIQQQVWIEPPSFKFQVSSL